MSIWVNMDPTDHTPERDSQARRTQASRQTRLAPHDAGASSAGADRLTILAHELGNMLDGSLRCLGLVERAMEPEPGSERSDEARRRLDTVRGALLRMSELVDTAMRGSAGGGAAVSLLPRAKIELGEAVFHAVDVLTPLADEHRVRIRARVCNGLGGIPAGALYPVILNGLRNAIEAIAAAGPAPADAPAGQIDVTAEWTEDGRVRLAIRDDGVGLPNAATEAIFRFGFSTKPQGAGVGLAVARAIVDELPDGTLRLFSRADRPGSGRPGAIFEVMFRPTPACE